MLSWKFNCLDFWCRVRKAKEKSRRTSGLKNQTKIYLPTKQAEKEKLEESVMSQKQRVKYYRGKVIIVTKQNHTII